MLYFGLHLKKLKPACHCSSSPKPLGLAICNSCKFSAGRWGEKYVLGCESGVFFHLSEHVDDLLILTRHAASQGEAPLHAEKQHRRIPSQANVAAPFIGLVNIKL